MSADPTAAAAELDELAAITHAFREHLASGRTLADWLLLGPAELNAAHALANYFYEHDQYDNAAQLYSWLLAMAPHDRAYMLGIAAVRQVQRQFVEAADFYIAAIALDAEDPIAAYHLAECLLQMGLRDQARDMIELAIHNSAAAEHATLRGKANAILDLLGPAPRQNP